MENTASTIQFHQAAICISGDQALAIQDVNNNAVITKAYLIKYASGFTPTAIKTTVKAGTFANGELQGAKPAGSLPNMKFADANYRYEFMNGANDTDGTSYVWCRTIKA